MAVTIKVSEQEVKLIWKTNLTGMVCISSIPILIVVKFMCCTASLLCSVMSFCSFVALRKVTTSWHKILRFRHKYLHKRLANCHYFPLAVYHSACNSSCLQTHLLFCAVRLIFQHVCGIRRLKQGAGEMQAKSESLQSQNQYPITSSLVEEKEKVG